MHWKCVTGTSIYDWLFSYGFANDEFCVNKSKHSTYSTNTHWIHSRLQMGLRYACCLHEFDSYSSYSWCVQRLQNVYAFNETRNVIQCKLGDELEMNQTNERTNKWMKKKIIQCVTHSSVWLKIKKKKQYLRC